MNTNSCNYEPVFFLLSLRSFESRNNLSWNRGDWTSYWEMRAHRLLFLILDFFSLKLVIWKACTHSSRSHASESRIYTHGLFLPRLTCLNTCQGTQSSLEGRRVQGSLGKSVPRKRFSTSCVLDKLCSLLSCSFAWESLSGYKPWGESCYCSCSRRLSSRLSSLPCIEETRQPVSSCISSSMQLSSCCVSVVMSVVSFGCILSWCVIRCDLL